MNRIVLPAMLMGLSLAFAPVAAHAQAAAARPSYRPIVLTFDGKRPLSVAPSEAFNITDAGTIEFWVSAKWQGTLAYDPAIMAYSGPKGPRYAFHITADRSGLGVYAGDFYNVVPFNFADGRLHYVAIIAFGDETDVLIDGQIRATLGFTFPELLTESLTIGSISKYSPFIGEIGQIRFWSLPLEPEVLNQFALRPIEADGPNAHPDIANLVAISAFANPELGSFVLFGDADDVPNVVLPAPLPPVPEPPAGL